MFTQGTPPFFITQIHNFRLYLYYDPLLAMFEKMIEEKFVDPRYRKLYYVCRDAPEIIAYLKTYEPIEVTIF